MRLRTLALSLIPGVAHVDQGRTGRGLLFFTLFAFCVNGAIVAPLVLGAREPRVACALAAAGAWIAALYDAVRLAARERATAVPEKPEKKESDKPVA